MATATIAIGTAAKVTGSVRDTEKRRPSIDHVDVIAFADGGKLLPVQRDKHALFNEAVRCRDQRDRAGSRVEGVIGGDAAGVSVVMLRDRQEIEVCDTSRVGVGLRRRARHSIPCDYAGSQRRQTPARAPPRRSESRPGRQRRDKCIAHARRPSSSHPTSVRLMYENGLV